MAALTTSERLTLGMLLHVWRRDAGLGLAALEGRLAQLLPASMVPSDETLRRYETDVFPAHGPNPVLVGAWARACGRRFEDLPPPIRKDLRLIRNNVFYSPAA